MKRMFRLFAGLLTTMLVLSPVSCKKTDDTAPGSKNEATIFGKWVSVSVHIQMYEGDRLVEEENIICEGWYQAIELLEDGTGYIAEVAGNESDITSIKWRQSGNKLIITYIEEEDMSVSYKLISIDDSELSLQYTEEYSQDGEKLKAVETSTFKKV